MFLLLHSKYNFTDMSSKNGSLLFASLLLIVSLLTSCLGGNDYEDDWVTEDAEIVYFNLSSDSVPGLKNVVFSIDQDLSEIYNRDSMAYLTEIKDKVIVSYRSASGLDNILNITDGDSIWVKSGDSIDVSKPLLFKTHAIGGNTTKIYTVKLNIHQVDPDSVQYNHADPGLALLHVEELQTFLFKDTYFTFARTYSEMKLYNSSDAVNWSEVPLSGLPANTVARGIRSNGEKLFAYSSDGVYYECTDRFANNWTKIQLDYPVVSILGYLKIGQAQPQLKEGLSLIVKRDNREVFAFISEDNQWTFGEVVPDNFPVSDFVSFQRERMRMGYVNIIGGLSARGEVLNDVWSTANGFYWAKLTNNAAIFPPLRGLNVIEYNEEYWLFNGRQNDGTYNGDIYFSRDGGMTWVLKEEKTFLPEYYMKRHNASVVVDKDGVCFYILGGRSEDEGILTDIWRGFLNRQTFLIK